MVVILISAFILFSAAYVLYGRFLEKRFEIDDRRPTPSHADYDGVDRVPAHRAVLLGHHFSSIAGAGPIVGPVLAALAFGWLPALLWVILGSIFIGGVHDFSALVASMRHRARSIADIAREHMSPAAYRLFLLFIWLTLVYILAVFADLTSTTFVEDGGVATSALLFITLALCFGVFVYRLKVPVLRSSLIFVPLVFVSAWAGQLIPLKADIILMVYCFVASTTPVWILLQPRDYLSSFLLYASVLGGFAGIAFGGHALSYPAFTAWHDPQLGALVPILFITVACGACSGFHAIVGSGTSSKQIDRETDARPIGYGAMLIEGIVAVIAICTVAMLVKGDTLAGKPPLTVYGAGMGKFLTVFGIPEKLGVSFGLLALSTFILTTLDTATRLGRYVFEEFFDLKGPRWRYLSTLATLALPTVLVLVTLKAAAGNPIPAWKAIWPIFGATNQLLAGLTLLVVTVWLKTSGKGFVFVLLPMIFMNVMTLWSLVLLLRSYGFSMIGVIAGVLLLLALGLIVEAVRTLRRAGPAVPPAG
jgi:carbon starvation protein